MLNHKNKIHEGKKTSLSKSNKKKLNKKANPTPGDLVAGVVMTIFVMVIVYFIFLPKEITNQYLNISNENNDNITSEINQNYILNEEIGSLIKNKEQEQINLPELNIRKSKNSIVFKQLNPFVIKTGLFSKKTKRIELNLKNKDLVANMLMSLKIKSAKGILNIMLNNKSIYETETLDENPNPIIIPIDYLKTKNVFVIEAEKESFFKSAYYDIADLRIIGDVVDYSNSDSILSFNLKQIPEDAILRYYITCDKKGKINILLNSKPVYSGEPICDSVNKHILSSEDLKINKNYLLFSTNDGDFQITNVALNLKYKPIAQRTFYFNLNNTNNIYVKFIFPDLEEKNFKMYVNGILIYIQTTKKEYEKDISKYLKEGRNSIKILPINSVDIDRMIVYKKE